MKVYKQSDQKLISNKLSNNSFPIMPQNIKIYKFLFRAQISTFDLKANISSPLIVTWKRSNETATTQPVEMVSGKAEVNQTLTLPVNMYFEQDEQKFQEKKSAFSFTMKAPKGDKQAGVVYVNLAEQVNNKIEKLENKYSLEKCPVKNSQVQISITAQCIGQKDQDSMSQASFVMQETSPSTLSLQSHYSQDKRSKIKEMAKTSPQVNKENINTPVKQTNVSSNELQQKDRKIKQLQDLVASLKEENKKLKYDLTIERQMAKKLSASGSEGSLINSLKQQILKGKSIQDKLQSEIDSYRQENLQNEKELESIRSKMDKIYQNLCRQFGIQQL